MWEKVDVSKRDLFLGPGGVSMKPNVRKIKFLKEEKGGATKKFRIEDGSGKEWVAKIGKEAQSETAAVRLVWGIGYSTEINYLVPELTIPGRGTFRNVRLEARPENVEREDRWSWKENPFKGTRELQGLKIMMAMLNNWDLKEEGNNITLLIDKGSRSELHFVVSDLGATFGKTGYFNIPIFWRLGRSKNNPDHYGGSKFIEKDDDGDIKFKYVGRNPGLFDDISASDVRWTADLLLQLSDKQIKDAFRAANYTASEIETFARAFKEKISELDNASQTKLARR